MSERKKVIVSACLLGENCKYNGGNNYNKELTEFLKAHGTEVIAVCPEVEGGLPVPRTPVELVDGVAVNRDGENVDAYFRAGVKKVLDRIRGEAIAAAILQPRSPSCGVKQVYDGSFTGKLISGEGMLTAALKEAGIPVYEGTEHVAGWLEAIIGADFLSRGK